MKTVQSNLSKATFTLLACLLTGTCLAASADGAAVDQPAPLAKSGATAATREEVDNARKAFAGLGLSLLEKQEAYRGLIRLGYANEEIPIPDFLLRLNTIRAVKSYQSSIGAAATGYLSEGQMAVLRQVAGPPFPWEVVPKSSSAGNGKSAKPHPFSIWQKAGYTQAQKGMLFRALYNRGLIRKSVISTDFSSSRVRAAVSRYQASRGAPQTGYLSKEQVKDLLADPGEPTPWERSRIQRERVLGIKSNPDGSFRGRGDWQTLALSIETKTALYRALYDAGFVKSPEPITDFSYRMEAIMAVEAFQTEHGYPATGFLTKEQVTELLKRDAPFTPFEQQEKVFEKYGKSSVVAYISQLTDQEFEADTSFEVQVTLLQRKLSIQTTGYVSEELIERSKAISLKPDLGIVSPALAILQPRALASDRDWHRWEADEGRICEIGTAAIEVEGFLGSARVPSVHFLREAEWSLNTLSIQMRLVNWDLDTVLMTRIGGRNYYMTWDGAGYNFTRRDGSKLKSIGIVYTQFLEGLMKSNGFEVKYRTVFGNDVIASFSALGFSKQLRAIRKNCRT